MSNAISACGSCPKNRARQIQGRPSAAAFGVQAVVVPRRHAPEATGSLAKAASGALESVPIVRTVNLARGLREIKEAGFWSVGLDVRDGIAIAEAEFGGKLALVLGAV